MDLERALGAWTGLAVGNAIGAPLESLWQNQIQIKHGYVETMIGGGWLDLRPGETSADAAFAQAAAEALVAAGGYEPERAAQAYSAILAGGARDISPALRAALSSIAEGVPAAEAARAARELVREDLTSNDVLTRAIPYALRFSASPEEAIRHACADARLTHARREAADGAAAVAALVCSALAAESFTEAFERADEALERTAEEIENPLPLLDSLSEEALAPDEPDAAHALQLVLFELARDARFEPALVRVINRGGASDVTGALAGAIAGALQGEGVIPQAWSRALSGRRAWRRLGEALIH